MFELFEEPARQAVVLAQDEARRLNHDYHGTEHLLLGLLRVEDGSAARVLTRFGLTVPRVRSQIERIVGTGTTSVEGTIPFTPRVKNVMESAMRESLTLGHDYIGTEHLLLGLLREDDGVAARILLDFDVAADEIRSEVVGMLTGARGVPPQASLPNDLLAAPHTVAPAATAEIGRSPAPPEQQAERAKAPEPEHAGSARRSSAITFEYGPASSETRRKIADRCGFRVDGDKVAVTDCPTGFLAYIVFLRVTEGKEALSPREHGLADFNRNKLTPTSSGILPYRTQSGAHIVVDGTGIRGVIRDPLDIDGNDVRPGLIVGFAADFRDISAIDIEFCGADSPVHRDELRPVRERPRDVDPKTAFQLVLRGRDEPEHLPFTIELELDELRHSRWRKVKQQDAAAFCRDVGRLWARSHLQRDDLSDDQRTRLAKVEAGDWEHIVTWMRAGDSGSYEVGHEDDLVHTEWLLASLSGPINGTLGFVAKP